MNRRWMLFAITATAASLTTAPVVAGPSAKTKSTAAMVAEAKAAPGRGSCGTSGQRGGSANVVLVGGHIGHKFDVVYETAELHRTVKVRILAVTDAQRDPQVPEVPTLKEAGADMVATAWSGTSGPVRVPAATRDRRQQPKLRERLLGLEYEPVGSTTADLARWAAPIEATGIALK